jgi:tetratricopeptide (TPR) repeat protein
MKTHEMHDWLKAGAHYRKKGNLEKALEAFAQARLGLLCEMGECLTSMGNLDDGRTLFEEVLEANARDIRANAGMGIIYLLTGDHTAAATAFGNVLHVEPQHAKAMCGLGMARKGNGQLQEAFNLLLQSLEIDPQQKTALQALAETGQLLGQTADVLPLLRKYAKRHPEDADIANDIAALENCSTNIASSSAIESLRTAMGDYRTNPDNLPVVQRLVAALRAIGKNNEATDVKAAFLRRNPDANSALLQF